jgi:hypothetical protein
MVFSDDDLVKKPSHTLLPLTVGNIRMDYRTITNKIKNTVAVQKIPQMTGGKSPNYLPGKSGNSI